MDLRQFRYFVAVAEELHFGRAAERLHLSQPPVSLAIKALEEELGVLLFQRTSRRILLTEIGQELLREARAVLRRVEAMKDHAARASQGKIGSLSIGFISLADYNFLPAALSQFHENFPDIQVSLHESTSDVIASDLEKGILDIGYLFPPPTMSPALKYRRMVREKLVVALPENHPLAGLKRVPMRRLSGERFFLFPRHYGPLAFDTIVGFCVQHGFSPRLEQEARQMQTTVSLVSSGRGVALVPESIQRLRREGVVYRPLVGPTPLIEQGVAYRADDDSAIIKGFLDCMLSLATGSG